jgi:hypothetical protein
MLDKKSMMIIYDDEEEVCDGDDGGEEVGVEEGDFNAHAIVQESNLHINSLFSILYSTVHGSYADYFLSCG